MKTQFINSRQPFAHEKEKGADVVFIRQDLRTGQYLEIFACVCYESWEQWGQPADILSENVENVEQWRENVIVNEEEA